MIAALADLGTAHGYSGPRDDVALAAACDWLSGHTVPPFLPTVSSLALYLTAQGSPVSRPALNNWLTDDQPVGLSPDSPLYTGGEGEPLTRRQCYTRVKPGQAGALVDDALQVLEDAQPHEHSLAKAKAGVRQWIAERVDRQSWGAQQAQAPTVIGSLHLHAVTARPPSAQIAPPPQGTGTGSGDREYPTETRVVVGETRDGVVDVAGGGGV